MIKTTFKTSSDPNHANLPSSVSLMKASEVEEVMAGRGGRYRHSNKVEAIEEVEEKVENYASMQSAVPGSVVSSFLYKTRLKFRKQYSKYRPPFVASADSTDEYERRAAS